MGGEAFAVDASIIVADAASPGAPSPRSKISVRLRAAQSQEYLSVLDDAAFSGATSVEPKVISPTDPAARYTASAKLCRRLMPTPTTISSI